MSVRIGIVGGGPGGLTLARLLQLNNVPCSIFEQEKSRFARSQGGTLDVHRDSGQEALSQAGLLDEFKRHMRIEGSAMRMLNAQGQIMMDHSGEDEPEEAMRPEIDRLVLRDMMLDSLEPSTIQWGRTLLRAEPVEDDKFDLHFSDGGVEKGYDIVIGADGAWSKIRPLLTDMKPRYSGITCLEARISNAGERYPELARRVGSGSCFQFGDKKSLMAQRNGDGSIRTYAMLRVPESWNQTCGIDWTQDRATEEFVAKEFGSWDREGQRLVLESDERLVIRPLYMLPVGISWVSKAGVTLIGDAAHLMTPFSGVGVNLAMQDALELSRFILKFIHKQSTLPDAIKDYEVSMFSRATRNAQDTLDNLNIMFSGDTAEEIVLLMQRVMGGGPDEEDRR